MKLLDIILENKVPSDQMEQASLLKNLFKNSTKNLSVLTHDGLKAVDSVLAKDIKTVFKSRTISGVKNLDDLVVQMSKGTLSAKGAGDLAVGLLKTKGVSSTQIRQVATQWVEQPGFLKAWASRGKNPTVKELMASGKGYTEEAAKEIVAACKKSNKFQNGIKNVAGTTGKTGANSGKTGASSGKGGTPKPGGSGSVPPLSTWGKIKNAAKSPGTTLVKGAGKVVNVVRKGFRSYGIIKLMTLLAVAGIGGLMLYDWWKKLIGGSDTIPTDDELIKMNDWVNCILKPLQDDDAAEIVEAGDEVGLKYSIAELGGVETGGHVIFYSDHTIKSANGKTGTWSCNQNGLLSEQSEGGGELSAAQLSAVIDELDDQLSGDFFESDSTDMMDALNALRGVVGKTYKGKDAIEILKINYPKVVGMSLEQHVNELTNLDFEAIEAKEDFLNILRSSNSGGGQQQSGDSDDADTSQGDGNTNTGLSHLTITWDSEDNGGGGGTVVDNSDIKFKPCGDFPFDLGCISDKIKELQTCLNKQGSVLKVDGYYGKKTHKDLLDMEMFADGDSNDTIITKVMFDNFMKKCEDNSIVTTGDTTTTSGSTTGDTTTSGSTTGDTTQTVEVPVLDTRAMIDKFGAERLENIKKMTVDGKVINDIMEDYLDFRSGKYVLKGEVELTENQLYAINRVMSGRGYVFLKDRERANDQGEVVFSKYVWVADRTLDNKSRREIRRAARSNERANRRIDRAQDRLDNLKAQTYDGQ